MSNENLLYLRHHKANQDIYVFFYVCPSLLHMFSTTLTMLTGVGKNYRITS